MKGLCLASFIYVVLGSGLLADSVTPIRTLRANTIISEKDIGISRGGPAVGFARISDVVGQETRVVLYPGRPILVGDIGPPSLVQRNQIVQVLFNRAGLQITTEARALDRGAVGDRIRVMNMSSRATLFGTVQDDGTIQVK